jgi:hypothetical protein
MNTLDERSLNYSIKLLVDASTSGISCSFVALAQHISNLAKAGDCEAVRLVAERLIDALCEEHNRYDETREQWIKEEWDYFVYDVCVMDDQTLPDSVREQACKRGDARHARRWKGEDA